MMNLIQYIKTNKKRFTLDNIFCYIENKKRPIIKFALYRNPKDNEIYIYENILHSTCLTDDEDMLSCYYRTMNINIKNIKELSRDKWSNMLKKSILNSINKQSETYIDLVNEINTNGGNLVYLKGKMQGEIGMLVGASSTDEDYYYVLIYKKNNEIHFIYDTYCHRLEYVNENSYGKKEYELINFIKNNQLDIINKIKNMENDVMVTKIVLDKSKHHYKQYKNNSLHITFEHCKSFFNKNPKCIEVLEDKINQLNDPILNSRIIKLFNRYINEYSVYYKPLDKKLKIYYKEFFIQKLNVILTNEIRYVTDNNIKSYIIAVWKTMNKRIFNN